LDDAFTEFLPVTNFPAAEGSTFDMASAVYVEKLNRIYIFGGWTYTNGFGENHDSIWYIDLPSPSLPQQHLRCDLSEFVNCQTLK
jgi:hypothetical protein